MEIAFLFSNPGHHVQMMEPVIRRLRAQGHHARVISLAELRGFAAPISVADVRVDQAIPHWRKQPSWGSGGASAPSFKRRLARSAVGVALRARLWPWLRSVDTIVVPNDMAFPYDAIVHDALSEKKRVVVMQEGIRFPLPNEHTAYGTSGATICAWGEASAAYFRSIGALPGRIRVTGNPRFDALDAQHIKARREAMLQRYGLGGPPLLYLSNPIDDQGFCTNAQKMTLFTQFVEEAAPWLVRMGMPLCVRLHPREDLKAFKAAAASAPIPVTFVQDAPFWDTIAAAGGVIVLASTVGLEALWLDCPLGVLAPPGHAPPFAYVASGAATHVRMGSVTEDLQLMIEEAPRRAPLAKRLVDAHLAHRGTAAQHVVATILGDA